MTQLSVWAPYAGSVSVETAYGRLAMTAGDGGWWRIDASPLGHGEDYSFLIDDATTALPDPRSRWQPHGVHGPTRFYDQDRFSWTDGAWRGVTLPGSVFYELHVGTFTATGTLDAVIERLDHLVDLGIDVVELMPMAAFSGVNGWGYDGVHLSAVHEPYGGPDALKRLVDACHERGLGVALDVVYNHLGPSGNYLPSFGPYFTQRHHTPWGAAVNLDDEGSHEVRRWIIDSALMWLRDFHIDALRLDAVHALIDESGVHLLSELSREVDVLATQLHRPLSLVAESDANQPVTVFPRECGGLGMTAQWSDDFHHALHSLLTGESQGYYADFAADPYTALQKTLTSAYFHAGTWSSFRGAMHGARVDTSTTPGYRFLGYLQDHDQVGNRATGDRITATISPGLAKIGAAFVFTSPFTPMLFMGEEWAASTPWQFFTDHPEPDLAEAVRSGRRREFAEHGWSEDDVPDPQDPATVERSRLDWSELGRPPHAEMLEWHRALIALRRSEPALRDPLLDEVSVETNAGQRWVVVRRRGLLVMANLAGSSRTFALDPHVADVVLASAQVTLDAGAVTLPAESVALLRVVAGW